MFLRSTRARPRRGPSCSAPIPRSRLSRSRNFASIFRPTARSSTSPKTCGRRRWKPVATPCARRAPSASDIAAIGITNQRETTLLWDRGTGRPVHRAIVWQDRRTAGMCARLKAEGHERLFAAKTGLLLDPYFSGTKLAWLLENDAEIGDLAARGELAFGTVDTYLLWRLTGGKVHATDATNASRTLHVRHSPGPLGRRTYWRCSACPKAVLPRVLDCSAAFGVTDPDLFGAAIPICGIAGDQQAALIGQACFAPGMVKSTYGTGVFCADQYRRARRSSRATGC